MFGVCIIAIWAPYGGPKALSLYEEPLIRGTPGLGGTPDMGYLAPPRWRYGNTGYGGWGQAPTPIPRITVSPTRIGPWAQGPRGLSQPLTSLKGVMGREYMIRGSAIPYNARARNVRACPRARARGMNPRWSIGSLF